MVQRRAWKAAPNIEKRNKIAWVWHSASTALILLIQQQDPKSGFALVKLQCPSAVLCPEKQSKPTGQQFHAFQGGEDCSFWY